MEKYNIIEAIELPIGTEFIVNGDMNKNEGIAVIRESKDIVEDTLEGTPLSKKVLVWKSNNKPLIIGEYETGAIFTKTQKPLTFFEAMAKADEGEKVTNSYVQDNFSKCYWHKDSKGILAWHDTKDCEDKYDINLVYEELQSNWYIYEE